jgi:hypothetical protein
MWLNLIDKAVFVTKKNLQVLWTANADLFLSIYLVARVLGGPLQFSLKKTKTLHNEKTKKSRNSIAENLHAKITRDTSLRCAITCELQFYKFPVELF